MRRQRTTSNYGTVVKTIRIEEDLTEEYPTLEERTAYCDTLDGKMLGNVCNYENKQVDEFQFDYKYKRGQILDIAGVSSTASDTVILTDYQEFNFQENDDIYLSNGNKLGKIQDKPEIRPIKQKGNRRREPYFMWEITVS